MRLATMLRLCSFLAVLVGLVVGTAIDEAPARPVEMRAGYRVLQADFHVHTRFSDGLLTPCDLSVLARRRGLDVIAVTEHNTVFPALLARACAKLIDAAPLVIIGEEITTKRAHVLGLGIHSTVDARMPLADAVLAVHRQGGVVIAAHPTEMFYAGLDPICEELDGIEIMHPLAFRGESPIGSYAEIEAFARDRCPSAGAMLGNSDYHGGSVLGLVRTFVFATDLSEPALIDAIREGRTLTFDPDGNAIGPPALAESLRAEPLATRDVHYDYRPLGALDRITRLIGFFGVVGLVMFGLGGRRRATSSAT